MAVSLAEVAKCVKQATYFCIHGFIKAVVFTANSRVFATDLKYTIGGINPFMTT
jgi:hypothetical protein